MAGTDTAPRRWMLPAVLFAVVLASFGGKDVIVTYQRSSAESGLRRCPTCKWVELCPAGEVPWCEGVKKRPLVQLLEGYWGGLPFGSRLAHRATNRFRKERNEALVTLSKTRKAHHWDWQAKNSRRYAQFRLSWLPRGEDELLPTDLGNTLWRGETQAGDRYRLELDVVLPRLTPLMEPDVLGDLSDLRNQLDAAARLCVAAGVATAVSVGLLLWHGPWLFLALAMYFLSWASYRSAVAAARRFSLSLAAAIDLYHLKLYEALSLKRPIDLKQERRCNAVLSKLFSGELAENEMAGFTYLPPEAATPAAEQGSPGTTAPPGPQ